MLEAIDRLPEEVREVFDLQPGVRGPGSEVRGRVVVSDF
jgi:hypothetical protein